MWSLQFLFEDGVFMFCIGGEDWESSQSSLETRDLDGIIIIIVCCGDPVGGLPLIVM